MAFCEHCGACLRARAELPPELWKLVLAPLSTKSVMAFSRTCRAFAEIASGDEFWAKGDPDVRCPQGSTRAQVCEAVERYMLARAAGWRRRDLADLHDHQFSEVLRRRWMMHRAVARDVAEAKAKRKHPMTRWGARARHSGATLPIQPSTAGRGARPG